MLFMWALFLLALSSSYLLVLFILLAVKFIKSKQEQFFAFGTLLSVAGFLIVVNILNPDAFIATRNDLTDMTSLDSKLYPYREELQKIIVAQRDGRTPDLYAEAVSERKEEPAADSSEKKWIRMTPAVEKIQKERQKGKLG